MNRRNPWRVAGNVLTIALVVVALGTALVAAPIVWILEVPRQWPAGFIGWYVFGGAAAIFYVGRWAIRRSDRWDRDHA